MREIACRKGCGACCIAPSISTSLPGMPNGKRAGVRCPHLTEENACSLYGRSERPKVCQSYRATEELCGATAEEAFERITRLEGMTTGPMGP